MTNQSVLNGWKSIAAHFGRDERTVMRWAEQRGLPVRRLPGGGRSSVFAMVSDLDRWLIARDEPAECESKAIVPKLETPTPSPEAPSSPPLTASPSESPLPTWRSSFRSPTGSSIRRRLAVGLLSVLVLIAATTDLFFSYRASMPNSSSVETVRDPAAERSFLQASYDLNLRTPDSLHQAKREFGAAIASDPSAAPAYSGLAETYLLLREYTDFPDGQAFARAAAAARAAVALQPRLASAHRVLAFIAFWHDRDLLRARAEFRQAIALAPDDAMTHHWYATALAGNAEYAAALAEIGRARRIDPQSTALLADYGLLLYLSGQRSDGLAIMRRIAKEQPEQISAHSYLADLALVDGQPGVYLAEMATLAKLRHDPALTAALRDEAAAARAGGMRALADELVRRKVADVKRTRQDYYGLARLQALRGDEPAALSLLRTALTRGEARAAAMPSDLMLRHLGDQRPLAALEPNGSLAP